MPCGRGQRIGIFAGSGVGKSTLLGEIAKGSEADVNVIALIGGSDVTLNKFYRESGRIRLQPANPTMQPMWFDPSQVQVQGVVVGMMRKYA